MKSYTYTDRLEIREYYGIHPNPSDKNGFEWKMSAIESRTWSMLRCLNYCKNFNPEYPVLNYFVDFGDPLKKIAIECDSKMFHFAKYKEDNERQKRIESEGWKFFRFNSAQIYSERYEEIIYSGLENGILEQICIDNHAYECAECFLNSSEFKALYFNYNSIEMKTGERYQHTQEEVVNMAVIEIEKQTLIYRSKL